MKAPIDERLERLLGGDSLVLLRRRLRRRFERAPVDGVVESFRISSLTVDEHAALAALLGRRARGSGSLEVDVRAIDTALHRAGIADSLRVALEQIDGPIVHIETARRESEAAWHRVTSAVTNSSFIQFLRTPSGIGLLRRLSAGDLASAAQICSSIECVLTALPATGITRAELAAKTLGDAHALDTGKAVATLVLAIWRDISAPLGNSEEAPPCIENDDGDTGDNSEERTRDIWARAGVLVNELARPALFLNLPASNRASVSGEPSYLSLRLLLRSPPCWAVKGQEVFVCENPNLLAIAADRLGPVLN